MYVFGVCWCVCVCVFGVASVPGLPLEPRLCLGCVGVCVYIRGYVWGVLVCVYIYEAMFGVCWCVCIYMCNIATLYIPIICNIAYVC